MKQKYPLTKAKLNRLLLELLQHPETSLKLKNMRDYAGDVTWEQVLPPTDVKISIDANKDAAGKMPLVVHELIHVVTFGMTIGWLDVQLEEVVVLSLEKLMVEYILKSPARSRLWATLIRKKLKEQEDADKEPEASLEDQSARPPSMKR